MNRELEIEIVLDDRDGNASTYIGRVLVCQRDPDGGAYGTYVAYAYRSTHVTGASEECAAQSQVFTYPRAAGPFALLAKALKELGFDPCKQVFRELSNPQARELKDVP